MKWIVLMQFLLSLASDCGVAIGIALKPQDEMKWIVLINLLLSSAADCDPHSLVFLSTGRLHSGDHPSFEQLTVYDGVPISYCDSVTRKEQLKPNVESKDLHENCDEESYNVLESLYDIASLITSPVYVVQRRRGCSQSSNGTVSGFETWAVNGTDFLRFDPQSQRWTDLSPSAVTVIQQWNNNNIRNLPFEHFINVACVRMISGIKVKPPNKNTELRVYAKPTANNAQALLRCHVTSTDRSVRSVYLIGDGAPTANWITVTGPLPCGDGSVILRLTAGILLDQNTYSYGCTAQTGSHNITVFWDGTTLDGRHLIYIKGVYWKMLITMLGFSFVGFIVFIISLATIFLLKCVKKKPRVPAAVDPHLLEHFAKFVDNIPYPDLQSVIVSYTQGTKRNRECEIKWEMMINLRAQTYYDSEFFGQKVDGPINN